MHRYIARLIGCSILALIFTLPMLLAPYMEIDTGGKNRITVRTDGTTSDIMAAIEALQRKDVSIRTVDNAPRPRQSAVLGFVMMAGVFWGGCSIVKRIEQSLSTPKKKVPDTMQTE